MADEVLDAPKKWKLSWEGESYYEDDLTMEQAEAIETYLGMNWMLINPVRSAKHSRGILAVLHADRTGASRDEVYAATGKVKTRVFVTKHLEMVDDTLPGSFMDGFPTEPTGERSTGGSPDSTDPLGSGSHPKPDVNESAT